jgi:hypothetical protein
MGVSQWLSRLFNGVMASFVFAGEAIGALVKLNN